MAKHAPKENILEEDPADLIQEHRGTYLLVNAVSRRVRQIQLGEKVYALPTEGSREPSYIAVHEFLEGKLEIVPRDPTPEQQQAMMEIGE
jgi:DNA-directed RNA polymerase subunit K/omega